MHGSRALRVLPPIFSSHLEEMHERRQRLFFIAVCF